MNSSYLSAPVRGLNPSVVPTAIRDSRVPAISRDEPSRPKIRGTGLAFLFLLAAFGGACVTTELRAQVIVVPNSLAANDGNSSNTTPDGPGSLRHIQVYDASQFGALSGPSLLTQFAYRPDAVPGPSGPRTFTLRIYASTTSRSVAGLSTTFAENIGTNNTLVFDGTVTATTENLPGPGNTRQFDVVFPLTTPFLYDPAAGNLLLDNQFTVDGSSIRLDSVTGNSMLGDIINFGSSTGTTGQHFFSPKPTQFTFVPPPPATPTFSDANWSSLGGIPGVAGEFGQTISAAVVDDSGNLYIGGSFNVAGEVIANNIAKWDGSSWSALGTGLSGGEYPAVFALAISGSNLYAGGVFTTAGGDAATNVAQWNGSSWSALGSGTGGDSPHVFALAVSGSNLYAGGLFTTAGGIPANNIAKWDGSSWSALGSGMDGDFGEVFANVSALAVSGNEVYAGGVFTTAGGIPANNIAKWDGNSWTALDSELDGGNYLHVSALAVWGRNLYAGGLFTTAGGIPLSNIAKWDGNSWTALSWGFSGSGDPHVSALAVSGNNLYAGGAFTTADGHWTNQIAKWDGSTWTALGSGLSRFGYRNDSVSALAVSGNDVYAADAFITWGGVSASHISKWDGSSWLALGSGIEEGWVEALAVSGSDLYAGGEFTTAGGSTTKFIAKWNGSSWSALGSGLDSSVLALAVSGGDLYVGGWFTTTGGSPANNIAKWNGSTWSALGSGMNSVVIALAASGNDVYAGGYFTTAGGSATKYIARWDGSSWSALGTGLSGGEYPAVFALAISGSNLYAGGQFMRAGGNAARGIAKWDGSAWSPLGSGIGGSDPDNPPFVNALAVSGNDVYAGGYFTTAGGRAANYIAKWDGSAWSPLGLGMNGAVRELAVSGKDVYAGGWFTTAGGSTALNIAKWDGRAWSALGSGMNQYVYALAVAGSDLYAGGAFTTAGGKVSAYVARAYLPALPFLSVFPISGSVTVSWATVDTAGFVLEQAGSLAAPTDWVPHSGTVTDDGTHKSGNYSGQADLGGMNPATRNNSSFCGTPKTPLGNLAACSRPKFFRDAGSAPRKSRKSGG